MSDRLDPVFDALADPTRRKLLVRLADGPASATALSSGLPMSRQAVSKHLGVMERAGLVHPERAGREVRYRRDDGPLDDVAGWLAAVGTAWDARLGRLADRFVPGDGPGG